MEKQYREVDLDVIEQLKSEGFTSIQFALMNSTKTPEQAVVEVIPGKVTGFDADSIRLNSREILDYFGEPSPMARYVIDEDYIKPNKPAGATM